MKHMYAEKAVELAVEEYGKDIDDLPQNIQDKISDKAHQEVNDRFRDEADNLRKAEKEFLSGDHVLLGEMRDCGDK